LRPANQPFQKNQYEKVPDHGSKPGLAENDSVFECGVANIVERTMSVATDLHRNDSSILSKENGAEKISESYAGTNHSATGGSEGAGVKTASPPRDMYAWMGSEPDLCGLGTDSGIASNTSLSVGSDLSEPERVSSTDNHMAATGGGGSSGCGAQSPTTCEILSDAVCEDADARRNLSKKTKHDLFELSSLVTAAVTANQVSEDNAAAVSSSVVQTSEKNRGGILSNSKSLSECRKERTDRTVRPVKSTGVDDKREVKKYPRGEGKKYSRGEVKKHPSFSSRVIPGVGHETMIGAVERDSQSTATAHRKRLNFRKKAPLQNFDKVSSYELDATTRIGPPERCGVKRESGEQPMSATLHASPRPGRSPSLAAPTPSSHSGCIPSLVVSSDCHKSNPTVSPPLHSSSSHCTSSAALPPPRVHRPPPITLPTLPQQLSESVLRAMLGAAALRGCVDTTNESQLVSVDEPRPVDVRRQVVDGAEQNEPQAPPHGGAPRRIDEQRGVEGESRLTHGPPSSLSAGVVKSRSSTVIRITKTRSSECDSHLKDQWCVQPVVRQTDSVQPVVKQTDSVQPVVRQTDDQLIVGARKEEESHSDEGVFDM